MIKLIHLSGPPNPSGKVLHCLWGPMLPQSMDNFSLDKGQAQKKKKVRWNRLKHTTESSIIKLQEIQQTKGFGECVFVFPCVLGVPFTWKGIEIIPENIQWTGVALRRGPTHPTFLHGTYCQGCWTCLHLYSKSILQVHISFQSNSGIFQMYNLTSLIFKSHYGS